MEKISGIVPTSRRVTSVDMKNAPPVRPGTPTFGRPVGVSTEADKGKPTTAELALAQQKNIMDKRSPAEKGPELIQKMADRFFLQKSSVAEKVNDVDVNVDWQPTLQSKPTGFKEPAAVLKPMPSDILKEENAPELVMAASPEALSEEEREYSPPGSYLDVVA